MTPDTTASRHGGNAQSEFAFKAIRESIPAQREKVYQAIKDAGMKGLSCKELAEDIWKVGANKISGRFTELKNAGRIIQTGTWKGSAVYIAR